MLYSDNCDGDRSDWGDLDLGVDGQLSGRSGYSFELSVIELAKITLKSSGNFYSSKLVANLSWI